MDNIKNHSNIISSLESEVDFNISFDTKQAAKYINLAEVTVRTSRTSGLLCGIPAPKFRKIGRKVIYLKKDIDDWLRALPTYQNTSEMLEGK